MRTLLLLLALSCWCLPVLALDITAIYPATVTPGATLTLAGGPFAPDATVLVGARRLTPRVVTPTQLSVTIPALAAGTYALAVEQTGARTARTFQLRVVQPPPRIVGLSPATLDSCAEPGMRQVTVSGSAFLPGTQLLLDNTVLPLDRFSSSELVFTLPNVKPGLHQVQAVNPDRQRSLPHGLFLDSTPQLAAVETGADSTVDYDLVLRGKNFLFESQLTVNGMVVNRLPAAGNTTTAASTRRDTVRYVDCTTLIYTRRPFLREPQELTLQIINPGGEQSNAYQIVTP